MRPMLMEIKNSDRATSEGPRPMIGRESVLKVAK